MKAIIWKLCLRRPWTNICCSHCFNPFCLINFFSWGCWFELPTQVFYCMTVRRQKVAVWSQKEWKRKTLIEKGKRSLKGMKEGERKEADSTRKRKENYSQKEDKDELREWEREKEAKREVERKRNKGIVWNGCYWGITAIVLVMQLKRLVLLRLRVAKS